jgi:Domain of unknown function (DUF4157)
MSAEAPVADAPEPTRTVAPPVREPAPTREPEAARGPEAGGGARLPAPPVPARGGRGGGGRGGREGRPVTAPIPGLPDTFSLKIGPAQIEIPLSGPDVRQIRATLDINLAAYGVAIPGVRFTRLTLSFTKDGITGGKLEGDIEAPHVHGTAHMEVDAAGNVSGGGSGVVDVEILGKPVVTFSYLNRVWSGSVTLQGQDIKLPIPNVKIDEGRATISFTGDQVTGSLSATFHHAALGTGNVSVTITNTGVTGTGGFTLTMPLLKGSHGELAITKEDVSGTLVLAVPAVKPPFPGLSLTNLTGTIAVANRDISGSFGLTAAYQGLATLTLANVAVDKKGFAGAAGTLDVTAPALAGSQGKFTLDREGRPHGSLTLKGDKIPVPGLQNPSVTITLREDGGVDVSGSGRFAIAKVGGGDFTVTYVNGVLGLGVDVLVQVPKLHPVRGRFDYLDGDLQGTITTGVTVGPLSGDVLLRYAQRQFSGEGRLVYSQGRFNGWVLIRIDPQGEISGEGEATFKLAEWLKATIGLVVHPDLNVDAHGELVFPAEIVLFPAWKFEKNFFHFQQEFPLWGITIPVVGSIGIIANVHANAGFRAAFGPGTIRNIKATGDVSTRADQEPAFTISGDFNVPAGAEVVLIVGGGIALSALIADIEGGIDLNGIAGIYGAITLTPTFAYRDGKYMLRGDALLAAAAQLRAGISAYAKIDVGIGWFSKEVWREDWKLAEWVFDTGWNVGLKAGIEYVLGEPFEPKLSFDEVAVDPMSIVKGAIPESGDPVPAPPKPPAPVAEFKPAEGDPGQVQAVPAAPPAGAAGPGPGTAGATAPAGPSAAPGQAPPAQGAGAPPPAAAEGAAAAAAPPVPGAPPPGKTPDPVDPPDAETEQPEERTIDETYLVYVYDNLEDVLPRKRAATAPADDELKRAARERLGRGQPPPREHPAAAKAKKRKPSTKEPTEGTATPKLEPPRVPDEREKPPMPGDERSTGKPLPPGTRGKMEAIFGEDLSRVRVHTDEAAQEGTKRVGAEAYAAGRDIYFAPSRDPEAGHEELLAHELTHVLQQEGDPAKRIAAPAGEAEREAEEAARKAKRGERPRPIRKRREAAIHRAAKKTFTADRWNELRNDPELLKNKLVAARIAELKKKEDVASTAKDEVWDTPGKKFRSRMFVPMLFPTADSLPHKSATGSVQIEKGDYLTRSTEERDDAEQSELAAMIKALPARLGEFSERPGRGEPPLPFMKAWEAYKESDLWKAAPAHESTPVLIHGKKQVTTESEQNLTLNQAGFRLLWDEGMRFWPATNPAEPGSWEKLLQVVRGEDPDKVDAATLAPMTSNYQAHHVIPLWLRSMSGRPDGDQMANLAPWHRDAHQTNHALHHSAIEDPVKAATGATSYLNFKKDTQFLISGWKQGKKHQEIEMPPGVRVDDKGEWKRAPGGKAIWWGE